MDSYDDIWLEGLLKKIEKLHTCLYDESSKKQMNSEERCALDINGASLASECEMSLRQCMRAFKDQELLNVHQWNNGFSLLGLMSFYGTEDLVEEAIELGADPNMAMGKDQLTPAMCAMLGWKRHQQTDFVVGVWSQLHSSGMDLNQTDHLGSSLIHYVMNIRASTLQNMMDASLLCWIIHQGGDVSARDHQSVTPLHICCSNSDIHFFGTLIQAGADVMVTAKSFNQEDNVSVLRACQMGWGSEFGSHPNVGYQIVQRLIVLKEKEALDQITKNTLNSESKEAFSSIRKRAL